MSAPQLDIRAVNRRWQMRNDVGSADFAVNSLHTTRFEVTVRDAFPPALRDVSRQSAADPARPPFA
jgi:hypothetical protein